MQVIRSVAAMQRLVLTWRRKGTVVGLVPTMGYLHHGHLSLVKQARRAVGKRGKVVLSIYVNPTQFSPTEDLSRYPRDLRRDLRLCREAGVDAVFTPSDKDIYPSGFSTYVVEEKLSSGLEGASRPTHFRGVTTVVAKLFNIVQPELAVFGAKDYQQAAVIKRMVRDLNFPLRIIVAPTVREPDGLAMSSRNKYLGGELRNSAMILSRTLKEIQRLVRSKPQAASALKQQVRSGVNKTDGARLDYVEFFDPETLEPVGTVKRGTHMALAVFIERTRLIDNAAL
jgi:pantoate--beta-alanine ligase